MHPNLRSSLLKISALQSTYTGVYARGGPTNIEASVDLSSYLDRSKADVRGVKKVRGTVIPFSSSPTGASPSTPPGTRTLTGNVLMRKSMDMVRF